ncbi:hypothetical protein AN393_02608 [Pseudoalteromonas sp. P1-25]|nr:hypothetical protein AN393_02608 [Pseudoalteromonas sp. P1-25]
MPLSALKNSHLEQLNSDFFALLSTRLSILKIDHLIMWIGIIKTYVQIIKGLESPFVVCVKKLLHFKVTNVLF